LDRFLIEFSDQRSRILERATQGVTLNRIHELEFVGPFRAQTERFADYVQRLKKKLQAVAEIERREASHKDYLAKQSRVCPTRLTARSGQIWWVMDAPVKIHNGLVNLERVLLSFL